MAERLARKFLDFLAPDKTPPNLATRDPAKPCSTEQYCVVYSIPLQGTQKHHTIDKFKKQTKKRQRRTSTAPNTTEPHGGELH